MEESIKNKINNICDSIHRLVSLNQYDARAGIFNPQVVAGKKSYVRGANFPSSKCSEHNGYKSFELWKQVYNLILVSDK